ncbi:MAG: bifunctional tetrahydrofolate synthase/dihydrofolate synthase [Rhodocyclaceae bacterium]|nr:bifunctional tetrahydrofolate synthase/dihydrofolate synthase [Rhodocyclaceae bacterium]
MNEWLAFIECQHPQSIELGLDRLRLVKAALGQRQTCPVILVGGTNGKGSTCALLEKILLCAGYRVGLYTSPHLLVYNERVRLNGQCVKDAVLCEGFARVEAARVSVGEIPLTYFEFGTLAAWEVFAAQPLDVILLEVGLGGRLDATNLYEPDVSIVTTIDLDHMDYLGATREAIGFEKAGIFRSLRPAICGDAHPPHTLLDYAWEIGADLQVIGEDFEFFREKECWQYRGRSGYLKNLPHPVFHLNNAVCALTALDMLWQGLPVTEGDIRRGLVEANLQGRFQKTQEAPSVILDVAHNPQAARMLAENLGATTATTWAVFGMMRDKDIAGVIAAMSGRIDHWLPCTLPGSRAATAAELTAILVSTGVAKPPVGFASPAEAREYALKNAKASDRIIAFGSFLTVAGVMTSSYGAT